MPLRSGRSVGPALVDINTDARLLRVRAGAGTGIVHQLRRPRGHQQPRDQRRDEDHRDRRRQRQDLQGERASATTRAHDIAVVQLQARPGLTTATIGDSSALSVGDTVVGVGNAGGVGGAPPSAAPGSVAALDQSITATDEGGGSSEQLSGLIQTNAQIQPGDSGGPLVDTTAG